MAEREGFEPSIEFPLYTLSKRAPSTTRPSLRRGCVRAEELNIRASFSEYHVEEFSRPKRRSNATGTRLLVDHSAVAFADFVPAAVQAPLIFFLEAAIRIFRRHLLVHFNAPARCFVNVQIAALHHRTA